MKTKAGITTWEITLFILFLTISLGSSFFFFFINSADMRKAKNKLEWVSEVNQKLDVICLEIANSITISEPKIGDSKACFFKQAADGTTLQAAMQEEGFYFADNNLYYEIKGDESTNQRFSGYANPIIANCAEGKFSPISLNQIELSFKMTPPDSDESARSFVRRIKLRNK
jgi:hypothetical protein